MPTDDCHKNYCDHLDDMQMECAPGCPLQVWEVVYRSRPAEHIGDNRTVEAAVVVAKDNQGAADLAVRYLQRIEPEAWVLNVRQIGTLMQSEKVGD